MTRLAAALAFAFLTTAACDRPGTGEAPPAAATPLRSPDAPLDSALVMEGEALFRAKACLACHRLDAESVVGPGMAGVTERRSYAWYRAMLMNPDSMIRVDPVAISLYAEYGIPMPDQQVTERQARAIGSCCGRWTRGRCPAEMSGAGRGAAGERSRGPYGSSSRDRFRLRSRSSSSRSGAQ